MVDAMGPALGFTDVLDDDVHAPTNMMLRMAATHDTCRGTTAAANAERPLTTPPSCTGEDDRSRRPRP